MFPFQKNVPFQKNEDGLGRTGIWAESQPIFEFLEKYAT